MSVLRTSYNQLLKGWVPRVPSLISSGSEWGKEKAFNIIIIILIIIVIIVVVIL